MNAPDYIAVEGAIGVGKTTLCARLAATLGFEELIEAPEENPFLQQFYDDPEHYALQVQLCFLLQRARQIDTLRQAELFSGGRVADFMFDKDRIFAQLNLRGDEWELYEEIYRRLSWEAPKPSCVIYLYAPVEVLMQRIRMRNRSEEKSITAEYLRSVSASYRRYFDQFSDYHPGSRLITLDASGLDLVRNQQDYMRLQQALESNKPVIHLS